MKGRSRTLVLLALVGLVASSARVVASERRSREGETLTAKEVAKYFAPYVPEVRGCYLANARGKHADGMIRLELLIHPSGKVFRFGFVANGVTKPSLTRLDKCLRTLTASWSFPARGSFTSAVLPFLFQRTVATGAGPIESCWDPRGCPPGASGGKR